MNPESLLNSSRISIRILVASLIIQQFRLLWNSTRIWGPWNSCEILPGFDQNSSRNLEKYFDQEIRSIWNSCEILLGFNQNSIQELDVYGNLLEFWWPDLLSNDSDDWNSSRIEWPRNYCENFHWFRLALSSNNSDDDWVLQELDDNRIFVKFVMDFIKIHQEIDDHRIIVKIFIDFDQNSVRQPYYYWRGNNKATN